ncbi:allantoicase [Natronocella acetinitrilica]|uniref:Probable allantoicase n=1 Tax=Natronocella acetinitrilica TaxID=414046 RepID=A0AAE3G263_9GAMM|nr:allantoicase [Natronocella acetinitrilica]MCP1674027.1 allantoicase [Natronocella acetinitrilica]
MSEQAIQAPAVELPEFARARVNLADASLGAEALACSDEFFADRQRMLNPDPAVFYPDRYDEHGKWMDGWETRRRRNGGHDWCVVRLALPGVILGVDLDTSFFTGNYPPAASIEACCKPDGEPAESDWQLLVASTSLQGDSHRFIAVDHDNPVTHLRLHIYPDGGIARLRVYGDPWCDWSRKPADQLYDLLALEHGARAIAYSDSHYGHPMRLFRPGRGLNMGDGWETRRRREPGNDWCILQLGHPAVIERVELDTAHFKGNYPDCCSIQAALVTWGTDESLITQSMFWDTLLPEQPLQADSIHSFTELASGIGPVSHVRLNVIPDGGVSRLRLWGRLHRGEEGA